MKDLGALAMRVREQRSAELLVFVKALQNQTRIHGDLFMKA